MSNPRRKHDDILYLFEHTTAIGRKATNEEIDRYMAITGKLVNEGVSCEDARRLAFTEIYRS